MSLGNLHGPLEHQTIIAGNVPTSKVTYEHTAVGKEAKGARDERREEEKLMVQLFAVKA